MCGRLSCSAGRRGATHRRRLRRSAALNLFADVTLVRAKGRCRRGNNKGVSAETAASLNYFAGVGLRCTRMKTATGHTRGSTAPRRHLVGLPRACLCLYPRVLDSAEQITEPGRLTRVLVRFLCRCLRLLRARGRFRQSGNQGFFKQTAWSPNRNATTDLRAAQKKKRNPVNITGHSRETKHGSSVSSCCRFLRPGAQASRDVSRGRAANVAPGPVCLPLLVFPPPTWSLPPEK